ncbi:MAG: DUF115 domain-containing protein [Spirochaetes bacterium]|nr:DUF115 domain-containing protein [Spirochaetota bacterium]
MAQKEIYKKNIEILKLKYPHLLDKINNIEAAEEDAYKVIATHNNSFTLQVKRDDDFYLLHSKYDPQQESRSTVEKLINDTYDIIFCGGFGLGHYIDALLDLKYDSFSRLIIIEKDPHIFYKALQTLDLSKILNDDKVEILFGHDDDLDSLNEILINSTSKKVYTFIPQAYLKTFPDFYKNLKNVIDSYLSRKNINIATLTRFQKLWTRNILKNYKLFLANKGVINLYDKYKEIPCLVISAGPSLNDYLMDIRNHQEKFIIICVDSVFQTLVRNNIYPDIVVTVDPQHINYKYFEYNKYYKALLVSESSTYPLILKHYKGRHLFFSSVFALSQWIENYTESKGEIDMGGSVSTTAFDLAYRMGCDPIILFGQDLSFIKDRTHTKGSYVEKYWALRYNKFNTAYNGVYKYIHNNLFIQIRSSNNKMINTDRRLMIFLAWFQNKMRNIKDKIKIYNTSLDGAKIENMIVKDFKAIMNLNHFKDIKDVKKILHDLDPAIKKYDHKKLLEDVTDLKDEMKKLGIIMDESLKLSHNLYNILEKQRKDNIQNILDKLDDNDKKIFAVANLKNFLGMTIQDRIYTILEDYETQLNEKEKSNEDLKIARRNIILYSGITESIQLFTSMFDLFK